MIENCLVKYAEKFSIKRAAVTLKASTRTVTAVAIQWALPIGSDNEDQWYNFLVLTDLSIVAPSCAETRLEGAPALRHNSVVDLNWKF